MTVSLGVALLLQLATASSPVSFSSFWIFFTFSFSFFSTFPLWNSFLSSTVLFSNCSVELSLSLCGWLLQACCRPLGLLHFSLSVNAAESLLKKGEALSVRALSCYASSQAWPPHIFIHILCIHQKGERENELKWTQTCWGGGKEREERLCFCPHCPQMFKANTQWKCVSHLETLAIT